MGVAASPGAGAPKALTLWCLLFVTLWRHFHVLLDEEDASSSSSCSENKKRSRRLWQSLLDLATAPLTPSSDDLSAPMLHHCSIWWQLESIHHLPPWHPRWTTSRPLFATPLCGRKHLKRPTKNLSALKVVNKFLAHDLQKLHNQCPSFDFRKIAFSGDSGSDNGWPLPVIYAVGCCHLGYHKIFYFSHKGDKAED